MHQSLSPNNSKTELFEKGLLLIYTKNADIY